MIKNIVILHGISSGYNYKNGGEEIETTDSLNSIYENIMIENSITPEDVFCHTWRSSIGVPETLRSISNSIMVDSSLKRKLYNFRNLRYISASVLRKRPLEINRYFNVKSRWESLRRALTLVETSEFSRVCVTRYDLHVMRRLKIEHLPIDRAICGIWRSYYTSNYDEIHETKITHVKQKIRGALKGYPLGPEGLHDFFFILPSTHLAQFIIELSNIDEHIRRAGLSNHHILLSLIKSCNLKIYFHTEFGMDYSLQRWVK